MPGRKKADKAVGDRQSSDTDARLLLPRSTRARVSRSHARTHARSRRLFGRLFRVIECGRVGSPLLQRACPRTDSWWLREISSNRGGSPSAFDTSSGCSLGTSGRARAGCSVECCCCCHRVVGIESSKVTSRIKCLRYLDSILLNVVAFIFHSWCGGGSH